MDDEPRCALDAALSGTCYCTGRAGCQADHPVDDGLTCDPCRAERCYACEGGCCWHECVSDEYDPADDDRPVVTVELNGVSR